MFYGILIFNPSFGTYNIFEGNWQPYQLLEPKLCVGAWLPIPCTLEAHQVVIVHAEGAKCSPSFYSEYPWCPPSHYLSFGINTLLFPRAGVQRTASFCPFPSVLHLYASHSELVGEGLWCGSQHSKTMIPDLHMLPKH